MRTTADVVVIGGGIQGLSCLYHLAARGITNISLVELDLLGSGSSGRSAAMLMLSMSREETIDLSYVAWKEYMAFPELFGESTHFKQIGYMTVATEGAKDELLEEVAVQRKMNVPIEMLDPQQVKEIVPAV